MRNTRIHTIIILIVFVLFSCRTTHFCSDINEGYVNLKYKIISKELTNEIDDQTVYAADILITYKDQKNPLDSGYYPDTLICYALSICEKESIVQGNFFTSMIGYDIMKKYDLNKISWRDIKSNRMTFEDYQLLNKTCFGSFEIKRKSKNWKKQLTSNNFTLLSVRRIYFKGDPIFNSKLKIK